MKGLTANRIIKFVMILFFLRAATAVAKCFLPFDLPHVWRQIDTLGVAIRYWLRWTVEPEVHYPLVPAVLNSLDGYGIMPMEFPLVNLLTAPFFAFGPGTGRIAAMFALFMAHFILTWLCYQRWKDKKILEHKCDWAFLLLPVIGISSTFVTKFMPDYLAMMLVLLGTSYLWEDDELSTRAAASRIFSICLIALGLLVKPTAVTVLVLLFLRSTPWTERVRRAIWSAPALLVAGLYYTIGLKWISSLQDTPSLFAVQARDPIASVLEFFSHPSSLGKLVFSDIAFPAAPAFFIISAALLGSEIRRCMSWLTIAIAMQILAIAALDGAHSFVHSYYHIATAPVVAVLTKIVLSGWIDRGGRLLPWSLTALAILLLMLIYENTFFELRSLTGRKPERYVWQQEIQDLKDRNPNFPWDRGYTFRASKALAYPNLGIHFGEREGSSTAEYGFFIKSERFPKDCEVVDESRSVVLVRCVP